MYNVEVERAWSEIEDKSRHLLHLNEKVKDDIKKTLQKLYTAGIQEGWKRNNDWYNPEAH